MAEVVEFTGGRRCRLCDEQIAPSRIHANPKAERCIACERKREYQIAREYDLISRADRSAVIIIRG